MHVANYYMEGMGYQENWLPYYQKELGNDVVVVTSNRYFPFPDYDQSMKCRLGDRVCVDGLIQDNGLNIFRKKIFFEIPSRALILFSASEQIKNFKPDVVHLHTPTNLNLLELLFLQTKYKFKLFIDSHSDDCVTRSDAFLNKVYYFIWKRLYRFKFISKRIAMFLPITGAASEWLSRHLGISPNRMRLSPLGVDLGSMYYSSHEESTFRVENGLENKIILVNAGKQYPGKNIEFIIDVMHNLIVDRSVSNVHLVLVGNANEEYEYLINSKLNRIKSHVTRLPFANRLELRRIYSAADIGIWPGIPSNTIQEAMACKTALVLPDNDIVGHLVKNNGFKFKSLDVAAVSLNLLELIANKDMLNTSKVNSLQLIKDYSWKSIAQDSLKIYSSHPF